MIYFLLIIFLLFVGVIYFFINYEKQNFYINVLQRLTSSEQIVESDKLLEVDLPCEQLNILRDNIVQILRNFSIVASFSKRLNFVADRSNIFEFALDEILNCVNVETISILLYDKKTKLLRLEAVKGTERDQSPITLKVGEGLAGIAFEEKTPIISNMGFKDPRFKTVNDREQRIRNIICVPLIMGDKAFGVLNIVNKCPRDQDFTRYDTMLIDVITDEIVRAIEEQALYIKHREKLELDKEFEIANKIQSTYLEKKMEETHGIKNSLISRTSKYLGGDFYFSNVTDDEYLFVIGDVSGKGLPAALVVSGFISMIKVLISKNVKFEDLPEDINTLLIDILNEDYYVTALFIKLNFKKNTVEFINCGHERPIMIYKDNTVKEIDISGFPLGMFDVGKIDLQCYKLDDVKRMCVLTDGLIDCISSENEICDSLAAIKKLHEKLKETVDTDIKDVLGMIESEFFTEVLVDDSTVVLFDFTKYNIQIGENDV